MAGKNWKLRSFIVVAVSIVKLNLNGLVGFHKSFPLGITFLILQNIFVELLYSPLEFALPMEQAICVLIDYDHIVVSEGTLAHFAFQLTILLDQNFNGFYLFFVYQYLYNLFL